ncbi:MAG: transglutaminaseTgpA domain-containing protein [Caldimicrobium sp.]
MRLQVTSAKILLVYLSLVIPYILLYSLVPTKYYIPSLSLFLIALLLEHKSRFLPRWLINIAGVLIIIHLFISLELANILENTLQTVLLLINLKLLEKKRLRDYFQIFLLEILLLGGVSFYHTSLWFFIVFILQILYLSYAMFIYFYIEEGEVRELYFSELKSGIVIFSLLLFFSFLLSVIFFLTLPRVKNPFFSVTDSKAKGVTGFTESIRLGALSEIQENTDPAFRITFPAGKVFDPEALYFRVIVYDTFDGSSWSRREYELYPWHKPRPAREKGIWGTIYLSTYLEGYLPALYGSIKVREISEIDRYVDFVLKASKFYQDIYRYEIYVQEKISLEIKEELSDQKKHFYLKIPKLSPAMLELAASLKGINEEETVRNIIQFFQKGGFQYSTKNLPLGRDSLEKFLFTLKRGNCEYFASATALLLRLNGIPARVVGGYKGAVYQSRGNYYLVFQNFAHAWVEAWIKGSWKVIDTTPPTFLSYLQKYKGPFYQLKLLLDTINFYYMRFIVDYDLTQQKKFFDVIKKVFTFQIRENFETKPFEFRNLFNFTHIRNLKVVFALLVLALLIILFFLKVKNIFLVKKEKKFLKKFLKILEKRGYKRKESEGLFELVHNIKEPDLREKSLEFVKIYSEYYYKEKKFDKVGLNRLYKCLMDIQRLK